MLLRPYNRVFSFREVVYLQEVNKEWDRVERKAPANSGAKTASFQTILEPSNKQFEIKCVTLTVIYKLNMTSFQQLSDAHIIANITKWRLASSTFFLASDYVAIYIVDC